MIAWQPFCMVMSLTILISVSEFQPCYKQNDNVIHDIPTKLNYKSNIDAPTSLDWRWYNKQTYTSRVKNEYVLRYCSACWAFAVASSLSDRINIKHQHIYPEWSLSPQVLLACDASSHGCAGGDPMTAYQYIKNHGLPLETCAPYKAQNESCSEYAKCGVCTYPNKCQATYPYQVWTINEYGHLDGEPDMINQLQFGPIVCNMDVTDAFQSLNSFDVYTDNSNIHTPKLSVSIVGYGKDSKQGSYWIGRNSWGDGWGDHGYFRIIRGGGTNNLGIEKYCSYATVGQLKHVYNATTSVSVDISSIKTNDIMMYSDNDAPVYNSIGLPTTFSWSAVNGTNYLTPIRNQLVPHYCSSSWAFAITSMMSDRLNINRTAVEHISSWPEMLFSVQTLLDAGTGRIGANCYGCGDLSTVFKFIENGGVPIDTCQEYLGIDQGSTAIHSCEICNISSQPTHCTPIEDFTAFTFSKWGKISGVSAMQQSIYEFGPIVCGIDATQQFIDYTSGVFEQHLFDVTINHYVEVVGWGTMNSNGSTAQFWVGKNSWGQYWGQNGLFFINLNNNNLGITNECFYGIPEPAPHP